MLPHGKDVNTAMELHSATLKSLETQGGHMSLGSEEFYDSLLQHTPQFHKKTPISLDVGFSRCQVKGKGNACSFSKRSMDNKFRSWSRITLRCGFARWCLRCFEVQFIRL